MEAVSMGEYTAFAMVVVAAGGGVCVIWVQVTCVTLPVSLAH
jgi:hypothetical protein